MNETSGPNFESNLERRDTTSIVRASGEIDVATAPAFAKELLDATTDTTTLLVIDLSSVSLLDSTGLGVLIDCREHLESLDVPADLRLVVSEPQIRKLFSVTGLDSVFSIFPTLELAVT